MGLANNIKDFINDMNIGLSVLEKQVNSITKNVERRIMWQVRRAKKQMAAFIMMTIFLLLALLFLTVGLIVFFDKFFSLDIVLLSFGTFFAFIAFVVKIVS